MLRTVRKVEAAAREATAGDSGTGFTIIRMARHQPPLRTLLDARKIGPDELRAAEQIELAWLSITTGGRLVAASLERTIHGGTNKPWPIETVLAVRNYQRWANYWADEWKRTRNPMGEVIWSAVIDEWPISVIAEDIGYGRKRTARAIVCGLRHYAAWTNMITGIQREAWIAAAQQVFDRTPPATSS
jgi:hypothetical protein